MKAKGTTQTPKCEIFLTSLCLCIRYLNISVSLCMYACICEEDGVLVTHICTVITVAKITKMFFL